MNKYIYKILYYICNSINDPLLISIGFLHTKWFANIEWNLEHIKSTTVLTDWLTKTKNMGHTPMKPVHALQKKSTKSKGTTLMHFMCMTCCDNFSAAVSHPYTEITHWY